MAQSLLARLSYIGLAKEVTPGTYVAPTTILPVSNIAVEDKYAPIRDESMRNNDSVLQGIYQGPGDADVAFDMLAYPDLMGVLLRAIIGPDTVTPATINTTLAAASVVGATTFSTTATVPVGSIISINSGSGGGPVIEYFMTTAVSGVGPFLVTVSSPAASAHANAASVTGPTTHTFKQGLARCPSYSITDYDAFEARGFPGCAMSELGIKIDPAGAVTFSTKWMGWPSAVQATPVAAFTKAQPLLGWQWVMNNGGAVSPRGVTLDWSIKREVESIHGSTGTQNPTDIFNGALTLDGTYKSRFTDDTDLNLFLNYAQQPISAVLTQPVGGIGPNSMGSTLAITTSQGSIYTGKVNRASKYVDSDFAIYGVANATDGGTMQAVLTNFTTTAY